MIASFEIFVHGVNVPPTEQPGRIAWLNKFGPCQSRAVKVMAELEEFAALGIPITGDGTADLEGCGVRAILGAAERSSGAAILVPAGEGGAGECLIDQCVKAAISLARDTGKLPALLPLELQRAAFAAAKSVLAREAVELAEIDGKIAGVTADALAYRAFALRHAHRDDLPTLACDLAEVPEHWAKRVPQELTEAAWSRLLVLEQEHDAEQEARWAKAVACALETHGTVDQRERNALGILPADEVQYVVEAALFSNLGERFDPQSLRVEHQQQPLGAHRTEVLSFVTEPGDGFGLSSAEHDARTVLMGKLKGQCLDASSPNRRAIYNHAREIGVATCVRQFHCRDCVTLVRAKTLQLSVVLPHYSYVADFVLTEQSAAFERQKHKERHESLHNALDELAADFCAHEGQLPVTFTELMRWSYAQTLDPSEPENG